ncbi:retrovirus-related Pol polyprotein from transposon 17.6 [Trichonephila clavipes]|nr:retrovirus-related Pol polyprotein from transposon 17.6 [Trichonephila clavipes]
MREQTSAHLEITKSKDKLNRYFYSPNCYRDMEQFVKTCDQCQRAGKPNDKKKAPLKLVPVIQEVFTKLNIDACGPLPITSKGNRYLITAICMSSKFPEAIPVSDISSRYRLYLTKVQGRQSYTPSELVYGKNLRTPETLVMEHWMEPEEEGDLVTEFMFKLVNRLKRCQEVAINKMEEMQVKRKTWYDKNAVKREFRDGDLVLVLATSRANKLAVQWIVPGIILNKIPETKYLVEIPGRRETSQTYHINMLKPYYKRPEHVNVIFNDETQNSLAYQELEIPYLENNSLVYDFEDVIQASELNKHLHDKQMDRLRELLNKYSQCFSNNPGLTNLVEHEIQYLGVAPETYGNGSAENKERAKLTIKTSKCKFAQQNVKFLGHLVGQGFRTPSEIKVQAVLEFPTPRTKTQIRAFLGLAGYYQKYKSVLGNRCSVDGRVEGKSKEGRNYVDDRV